MKCEENEENHPRSNFGDFLRTHKNFNIGNFETPIFAIHSRVLIEAIEVLK